MKAASARRLLVPLVEWLSGDVQGFDSGARSSPSATAGQLTSKNARASRLSWKSAGPAATSTRQSATVRGIASTAMRTLYRFTAWQSLVSERRSAGKYGGHFVMAGFELAQTGELVVYNWTWIASTNGLSKSAQWRKNANRERRRIVDHQPSGSSVWLPERSCQF